MGLVIFHGSEQIIQKPLISKGRLNNGFGQGFYCTESEDLAKEWACFHHNDGYANAYNFDVSGLSIMDLTTNEYNILHWVGTLCKYRIPEGLNPIAEENRQFLIEDYTPDLSKADIVVGYRADDSYFSYARTFLEGNMPISLLAHALKLGELGIQITLKSQVACDKLQFLHAQKASFNVFGTKALNRDRLAREQYFELSKNRSMYRKALTLNAVIDGGVAKDDPRLSENLPWRSHAKPWGLL